jgi:aspartate ammonia-lyase
MIAREEASRRHVESSVGVATALVPLVGYEKAASVAVEALNSGRTVREVAAERLALEPAELDEALDPQRLAALLQR